MIGMQPIMTKYCRDSWRDLTVFGSFVFYILILFATLLLKETTLFIHLLFGLSILVTAVVLIRAIYFKNRPRKESHHTIVEKIDASSFPSLHTAKAFFLAITFAQFGAFPVQIFLFLIAGLTGYSRIYLQKHDWVDVIAGAILGIGVYWILP
jgi:membrane-associated phospholipid phosphatase